MSNCRTKEGIRDDESGIYWKKRRYLRIPFISIFTSGSDDLGSHQYEGVSKAPANSPARHILFDLPWCGAQPILPFLGVYEITRKIISQFERSGYTDWPQEEKIVTLCALRCFMMSATVHSPIPLKRYSIRTTSNGPAEFYLEDTEINRVLHELRSILP